MSPPNRPDLVTPRGTTRLVVVAVVAANLAFGLLAAVFDYPDVLALPPAEALTLAHERLAAVTVGFALLVAATALLAPVALGLARHAMNQWRRTATVLGLGAAAGQVVGLARWVVLVPFLTPGQPADVATFALANHWVGAVLGERLGYALTAAWTVALIAGLRPGLRSRAVVVCGLLCALCIAAGLLVPLGVPGADEVNFAGYLGWSIWLLVLAVRLIRRPS